MSESAVWADQLHRAPRSCPRLRGVSSCERKFWRKNKEFAERRDWESMAVFPQARLPGFMGKV